MCGCGRLLSLRNGDLDEWLVEYVAEDEVLFVEVEGGGRGGGAVALALGFWIVSSAESRRGNSSILQSAIYHSVVDFLFLAEEDMLKEIWMRETLTRYG